MVADALFLLVGAVQRLLRANRPGHPIAFCMLVFLERVPADYVWHAKVLLLLLLLLLCSRARLLQRVRPYIF